MFFQRTGTVEIFIFPLVSIISLTITLFGHIADGETHLLMKAGCVETRI